MKLLEFYSLNVLFLLLVLLMSPLAYGDSVIGKATLTSPSGIIDETTPAFTWKKEEYSTWYKLWVGYSDEEKIFTQWYDAAEICSAGNCSVTPALVIPAGNYEWYVKSWNDNGKVWSDGMAFTIQTNNTLPSKISHISPSGTTQNSSLTFAWNADPASTWYKVWIGDAGPEREKFFTQWYDASETCSDNICTIRPELNLLSGDYEWYVKSWNNYGKVWSDGMSFTISDYCDSLDEDGRITLACAGQTFLSKGYDKWVNEHFAQVLGWPYVLKVGTVIEEGFDPEAEAIVVKSESWFLMVDESPGALWNHRTLFVLVDTQTREVEVFHRESYPRLDGAGIFSLPGDIDQEEYQLPEFSSLVAETTGGVSSLYKELNSALYVTSPPDQDGEFTLPEPNPVHLHIPDENDPAFANFPKEWVTQTEAQRLRRFQVINAKAQPDNEMDIEASKCPIPADCAGIAKRIAVIIHGGRLKAGGAIELSDYLKDEDWDVRTLLPENDSNEGSDQKTTIANVEAAFQWAADNVSSCCDEVIIAIHAHGSARGKLELNPRQKVELLRNKWETIGDEGGGEIGTERLKELLDKIKSCQVKVYLHSCYAGVHLSNGLNFLDAGEATGCICRTTMMGSILAQPLYGGFSDLVTHMKNGDSFTDAWRKHEKEERPEDENDYYSQFGLIQSTPCELCEDGDDDGLLSGIELSGNYSDPTKKDTDGDKLIDGAEYSFGSDPRDTDKDGDKLNDFDEFKLGTEPNDSDSDDDNLPDGQESFVNGDPLKWDTDGDGLSDGREVFETHTKVDNPNSDGDIATDLEEIQHGTDPNDPNSFGCLPGTSCDPTHCGDGKIDESSEECDGSNLNNKTCEDIGEYTGGTLSCSNCTFDTSGCESSIASCVPGESLISVDSQNVTIIHDAGMTECPTYASEIQICNISPYVITLSGRKVSSWLGLAATSYTVGPESCESVYVYFDCSDHPPLEGGSIQLAASTIEGCSQEISINADVIPSH